MRPTDNPWVNLDSKACILESGLTLILDQTRTKSGVCPTDYCKREIKALAFAFEFAMVSEGSSYFSLYPSKMLLASVTRKWAYVDKYF